MRLVSRAFSLVEVLLAILILALGLLGLGAIIPAVVKMQRDSTDKTLGVAAANSAKANLLSRPEFSVSAVTGVNAWDNWLSDTNNWSQAGPNLDNYLWEPWLETSQSKMDFTTGEVTFDSNPVNPALHVVLSMGDRLWPGETTQTMNLLQPGMDPGRPQFVWDIVGRRVATSGPPQVQVAIFVRRIDLAIRVPSGNSSAGQPYTLRDVLTNANGVSGADHCVPVAVVNSLNDPTPTNRGNNGSGIRQYGNFQKLDAWFDPARRDRIDLSHGVLSSPQASADELFAIASQLGQKLVDNFGNVYTVLRTDEELETGSSITVVVSPSIPASIPSPSNANTPQNERFRQVIFTPQVAASVEVFTVTRPVK